MELGRAIHRGNRLNSWRTLCEWLLVVSIAMLPTPWLMRGGYLPERLSAVPREAYVSANELYDFKMPGFQQWLRENRLLPQPSEGDTDFSRRVFLALEANLRYEGRRAEPGELAAADQSETTRRA